MSVVVFGGYGTFGLQVARELARRGVATTIAGRDAARARALAAELGPEHAAIAADVNDEKGCRDALAGAQVAVCCAGPFSEIGDALLNACADLGCHYVDIADDRRYVARVRAQHRRFAARGRVAAYGCSSLPGLSVALSLAAREREPDPPEAVRVTLFIGNANPKGAGAIASAVATLGKPIAAPQGTLVGFGGGETVALPPPFGRRRVYDFEGADYDLLPALTGATRVTVKVGFELGLATRGFALLAKLSSAYGARTAALLERFGRLGSGIGSSGGAVLAELRWRDGRAHRASLSGPRDGQRMAGLPAALVAQALAAGVPKRTGALAAHELLGTRSLLDAVAACGYDLSVS